MNIGEIEKIFNTPEKLKSCKEAFIILEDTFPVIIVYNRDTIVCATKKNNPDFHKSKIHSNIQPVYSGIYSAFSGNNEGVNWINNLSKEISQNTFGQANQPVDPKTLCKNVCEHYKLQVKHTDLVVPAFGGAFFGWVKGVQTISYINTLGVSFFPAAAVVGKNRLGMTLHIYENMEDEITDNKMYEVVVSGLKKSIGASISSKNIEVSYLKNNEELKYLSEADIEKIIHSIRN